MSGNNAQARVRLTYAFPVATPALSNVEYNSLDQSNPQTSWIPVNTSTPTTALSGNVDLDSTSSSSSWSIGGTYDIEVRGDLGGSTYTSVGTATVTVQAVPAVAGTTANTGTIGVDLETMNPSDNGSPITGWEYTSDSAVTWRAVTMTFNGSTQMWSVTGVTLQSDGTPLVQGSSYPFGLRAINALGPALTYNPGSATAGPIPSGPTLTSVSYGTGALVGTTGPAAGGGTLTLTGTTMAAVTSVTVVGVACPVVGTPTATTVTCTLPAYGGSLTNGRATGDVSVSDGSVTSTLSNGFTYLAAPTLGSIAPTAGPLTSPGTLTITGTGFAAPAVVNVGSSVCSSPSVVSATSITCTLPNGTAGTANVSVTTTAGTSTTQAFTYVASPTIATVAPTTVSTAGGTTITITGTGFVAGSSAVSVSVSGSGTAACASVTVASSTSLTCSTPARAAAQYNVTVVAAGGSVTSTNALTYAVVPVVTSVSPAALPDTGGAITITGTGFSATAGNNTVAVGSGPCTVTAATTTSLTCTAPAQSSGQVDVAVTVAGQTGTLPNGLRLVTPPTVTAVSPSQANSGSVTVTGTGFVAGQTAISVGSTPCTSTTVLSATGATCVLPTPPSATATVAVAAAVYSVTGATTAPFTWLVVPTAPTAVTAASASRGAATVTFTVPSSDGGSPITAYAIEQNVNAGGWTTVGASSRVPASPSTATTVDVSGLTQGASVQFRVFASNAVGDGAVSTPSAAVTVSSAAPAVSSVTPTSGSTAGGTAITLTGTGLSGVITVSVGGAAATSVVAVSATQVTAVVPAGVAGPAVIDVTDSVGSTSASASFTYVAPPAPAPSPGGGGSSATPTPSTSAPGSPRSVILSPGNRRLVASWLAPSGAPAAASYRVTVSPGSQGCTTTDTSCAVDGLVNGTSYLISVVAVAATGATSEPATAQGIPVDPLDPTTQSPTSPLLPGGGVIPPAGLSAGASLLLVDGTPATVEVRPSSQENPVALVVTGGGLQMRLEGRGDVNDPLGLTPRQALVLQSERIVNPQVRAKRQTRVQPTVQSSGSGFRPGGVVKLWLLPSTYLGELSVDASGAFSGRVPVPPGLRPAAYTLQANGIGADGGVRSLNLGVVVRPGTAQAMREVQARVFFPAMSAVLSKDAATTLRRLARRVGTSAAVSVVVGFVQPVGSTANDRSLSTARARAVATYLRERGVTGEMKVRGDGRATEAVASARRVVVTIRFAPGS